MCFGERLWERFAFTLSLECASSWFRAITACESRGCSWNPSWVWELGSTDQTPQWWLSLSFPLIQDHRLTLTPSFNVLVRYKSVIRDQGGLMLQCDLDLEQLSFRTMCPGAQAPLRSEPSVWLSDNPLSRLCTLVALEMLRVKFIVLFWGSPLYEECIFSKSMGTVSTANPCFQPIHSHLWAESCVARCI